MPDKVTVPKLNLISLPVVESQTKDINKNKCQQVILDVERDAVVAKP
jgi:hypothetical protein